MRKTATAVAALFFTNGAAFASWAPRIPELADRIDVDLAGLGLTLAMVGVGGLAGTPTAGWLIDRIGSRKVASGGALLMSLLIVLVGFAPTPVLLGGALLFVGFFDVATDLGMNAQAMIVQADGKSLINRFHGLWSVGTVVGGAAGAAAAGAGVSLGAHLLTVGVVVAAVVGFVSSNLSEAEAPSPEPLGPRGSVGPMVVLGLLGFAAAFLEAPGNEWSATLVDGVHSATPAVAALGFVAFTAGMTTSRLAGDMISGRWGDASSFVGSLAVAGAGWAGVVFAPSATIAIAGLGVAGLGTGMVFPQLYASGASGTLVSQGRGLSAMSFGARLGFLLVTPTVGFLGSAVGLDVALGWIIGLTLLFSLAIGRTSNHGVRRKRP